MSYNILNKNVNFQGATQGTIEDLVDTHSNQAITGSKDFNTLTGSNAHVGNILSVGTHANNHAVCVAGDISGSGNISGSAFYGDGSSLTGVGGTITAINDEGQYRVAVFGSPASELDGYNEFTYNGSTNKLSVAGEISGSGNISGSQFYGQWAGSNINGSQIQLASGGGITDSTGLKLDSGVSAVGSLNSSDKILIFDADDSDTVKRTTAGGIAALAAVDSYGTQGANKVLIGAGGGSIAGATNLNFFGGNILAVTGALSASTNLEIGGTVRLDGAAAVSPAVADDKIYILDADDNLVKSSTFSNFVSSIAGSGLAENSGVMEVGVSGAVHIISDKVAITGSFADLGLAFSGESGSIDSIKFDPNSLTAASIAVANDSIVIIDADDNQPKKEAFADVVTTMKGNGLTATSGILAVGAGTGIDVNTNDISVDVSDFMTNGSNNRIVTATGTDAMNAEANLSFDGSLLQLTGSMELSGSGLTIIGGEGATAAISLIADQGDDAADTASISVADGGAMTIDLAGSLSLDSDAGEILLKDNNVEFSSLNRTSLQTSETFANSLVLSASAGIMQFDSMTGDFIFASGSATRFSIGSSGNNAVMQPSGDAANDIIFLDGDESANEIIRFDGSERSVVYSNASKTVFTPSSVNNFTGSNPEIPISATYVKIDGNGSARTGMRFANVGTAGQFLIVENSGGESLTFHSTGSTALITTNADNDTMMPGEVFSFISNGTAWFLIGGDLQAG